MRARERVFITWRYGWRCSWKKIRFPVVILVGVVVVEVITEPPGFKRARVPRIMAETRPVRGVSFRERTSMLHLFTRTGTIHHRLPVRWKTGHPALARVLKVNRTHLRTSKRIPPPPSSHYTLPTWRRQTWSGRGSETIRRTTRERSAKKDFTTSHHPTKEKSHC